MQEGKHHLTRSSTFHFHFVYSVLYLKLVGSPRKMVIIFTRSIDMIIFFLYDVGAFKEIKSSLVNFISSLFVFYYDL
jgi:hypothetical protein